MRHRIFPGLRIALTMTVLLPLVPVAQPLAGPKPVPALPQALQDTDYLYDGKPGDALVQLGRALFFDPVLSGNRNISCGTCHDPAFGSGDGLALGIGEGGQGAGPRRVTHDPVTGRVPRNAQPLWNIGARSYTSMFHDGRVEVVPGHDPASSLRSPAGPDLPTGLASVLAAQAFFPVTSPIEMAGQYGEGPIADAAHAEDRPLVWSLLARRVAAYPGYMDLLRAAYPAISAPGDVTYTHLAEALAAFQTVGFRSDQSPFDTVLRTGDMSVLSEDAQAGLSLFYGDAGCARCHAGPLLTDHAFHAIAVPQIGPGKGHGADTSYWRHTGLPARTEDEGRYRVTFDPADRFAFRAPSLRNVALTGPWGHSGAFDSLEAMVRHHLDPGASLTAFRTADAALPRLDRVKRLAARGSDLGFVALEPGRRAAFDRRDGWVMGTPALRGRIAAANQLAPTVLTDRQIDQLLAFLDALTDPSAANRQHMIPARVPSGLPPQPAGSDGTPAGH